tara:strand:- start:861 stop:1049 length:189 start_codon:yes stop_codon:yes gene_type:complete
MRKISKESSAAISSLQMRLDACVALIKEWVDTMWLISPNHDPEIKELLEKSKLVLEEEYHDK